jgi:hypothetical protein
VKIIKVVYDDESKFIIDIISKIEGKFIFEAYNISYYKDSKKARGIMERHGTKQVPLIVFENENLDEFAAIWSETNPDWLEEIRKILTK